MKFKGKKIWDCSKKKITMLIFKFITMEPRSLLKKITVIFIIIIWSRFAKFVQDLKIKNDIIKNLNLTPYTRIK